MSSYSSDDILRMQQDAVRRVKEMQLRARESVENYNQNLKPGPDVQFGQRNRPENKQTIHNHSNIQHDRPAPKKFISQELTPVKNRNILSSLFNLPFKGKDFLKIFNFKNIKFDSDTILIVMLILMLANEDTDELLIFALVYIML